jgi:hypothetical protein
VYSFLLIFSPTNSSGFGPVSRNDGAFEFSSETLFANPIPGYQSENLVLQFVPASPLIDTSNTNINHSNINLNDGHSGECFDCSPYVCFVGATNSDCVSGTVPPAGLPEPDAISLLGAGLAALGLLRLRRPFAKHPSALSYLIVLDRVPMFGAAVTSEDHTSTENRRARTRVSGPEAWSWWKVPHCCRAPGSAEIVEDIARKAEL